MKSLWRALAGFGVALSLIGCANIDRPNLRREFGFPLRSHAPYYHHMQHHWHGVCCPTEGHRCAHACCDTPHACHYCGAHH